MEFIQRSIIHHGLVTRQLMTSAAMDHYFWAYGKAGIRNPEPEPEMETETEPESEPELEPEPNSQVS